MWPVVGVVQQRVDLFQFKYLYYHEKNSHFWSAVREQVIDLAKQRFPEVKTSAVNPCFYGATVTTSTRITYSNKTLKSHTHAES